MTRRNKKPGSKPAETDEAGPKKLDASEPPKRRVEEQPRAYPDIVDDTLDDSFPASDPPFWSGT